MKSKRLMKQVVSAIVATSMLASSASAVFATGTSNSSGDTLNLSREEAVDILTNLTDEQRAELSKVTQEAVEDASTGQIDELIDTETSEEVRVIVEFTQAPTITENYLQQLEGGKSKTSAEELVEESHNEFKQYVESLTSGKSQLSEEDATKAKSINIEMFYSDVFNGAAVTLRGDAVEILAEAPGVKKVWNDNEVNSLSIVDNETTRFEDEEYSMPEVDGMMHNSKSYIGVEDLHNEGITGKGVKVGVIDTGIDYNHPDLTDAYKGYRAGDSGDASSVDPNSVKGWDFVDNDADPMETTYDDWLSSGEPEYNGGSYYTSHGTHVSGTIAGQGVNDDAVQSVLGVAPDAELYGYRVLGPYGSGYDSAIIGAIEKSVADGMDVINLSLGASVNDPYDAKSVAINNATLAGVVCAVAAGNSGGYGYYTLGTPGVSPLGISVGASTVDIPKEEMLGQTNEESYDYKVLSLTSQEELEALTGEEFEIVFADYGLKEDFEKVDAEGKIAFVGRGEITFAEKMENAKEAGAALVVIYNTYAYDAPNEPIDYYLGKDPDSLTTFTLGYGDAEKIYEAFEAGIDTKVTFGEMSITIDEGDHLGWFSSLGPVMMTDDIKPDIVAPGVEVYSTYPSYMFNQDGDYTKAYASIDGTSMATPHIAGIAALMLENDPSLNPFEVKTNLMNTSEELKDEYSVYEIGAGRVNAYEAVHNDVRIYIEDQIIVDNSEYLTHETGSVRFGRVYKSGDDGWAPTLELPGIPGIPGVQDFTNVAKSMWVSNNSGETKKFEASVEFTSPEVVDRVEEAYKINLKDAEKNGLKASIQGLHNEIEPGESTNIALNIEIPYTAEVGIYEGYVLIEESEDSYKIPFALTYAGERGVDGLEAFRYAYQHDSVMAEYEIVFEEPLETLDVILVDGETDEVFGYASNWDWSSMIKYPDMPIVISPAIKNRYYEFIDSEHNPIDYSVIRQIPEGHYKTVFIGVGESGEVYEYETDMFADATAPELSTSYELSDASILELTNEDFTIENGKEAFWFDISIYDETIAKIEEQGHIQDRLGTFINQGAGSIILDREFMGFADVLNPNSEGNVRYGIAKEDFLHGAFKLQLEPQAYSGMTAMNDPTTTHQTALFVLEDAMYITGTYDKDAVVYGDTMSMALDIKGAKDVEKVDIYTKFSPDVFTNFTIEASDELKEFANEHNMDIVIEEVVNSHFRQYIIELVSEDGEITPINGDMPLANLSFEVTGVRTNIDIDLLYAFVNDQYENEDTVWAIANTNPCLVHDRLHTNIVVWLEGPASDSKMTPYSNSELEYEYTLIDPDGIEHDLSEFYKPYMIDDIELNTGSFWINGKLELKEGEYTLVYEAPGHLTNEIKVEFARRDSRGILVNAYPDNFQATVYGGDVNGDGKIDLLDAIEIYENMGEVTEETKHLDINQDGVIDNLDLAWVYKNYLIGKDGVTGFVTEKDGITLEDLLYSTEMNGTFTRIESDEEAFIPGETVDVRAQWYCFDMAYENVATTTANVIVAQYNEDNELIDFSKTAYEKGLNRGIDETISIDTLEDAHKVKVFMTRDMHILTKEDGFGYWYFLDNEEPLGKSFEIYAEDN